MAGAIAPDTAPRWDPDRPGAKVPGQRPTRPWRALACCCSRTCRSTANCSARAGKCGSRFLAPPEGARALSPRQWQGPSPLPQRRAGIRTGRGPKPPASARHAPGGRFSPAGSGAGLRCSRTCRSVGQRPARAGETRCVSCSRPEGRKHFHRSNGRGHRPCHSAAPASGSAGGQSPRPAPDPPPSGASPPPGRALACGVPGPAGPQGTIAQGRGKRGSRFLFPAKAKIPLPGSRRVSRQASDRIAVSAPCRGQTQAIPSVSHRSAP